jgi:hypothetical protein
MVLNETRYDGEDYIHFAQNMEQRGVPVDEVVNIRVKKDQLATISFSRTPLHAVSYGSV